MTDYPRRTHTCGELGLDHVGQDITLNGWVGAHRDLGGLTFIDLRDRHGITQVVLSEQPDVGGELRPADIRAESVLSVTGQLRARPEDQQKGSGTGAVELEVSSWSQLSPCDPLPFDLSLRTASHEETRLTYRYLDLRRPELMDKLVLRHKVMQMTRRHLDDAGFLEIETPMLTRSTPEGARDHLVPSRMHRGSFYALPQSPQLFKQLLMVAGADRYMQIVRCFRDEDLRADRQPEFTQIDLEMSFVDAEDVMAITESLVAKLWSDLVGVEVASIPRMTYADAMERYGTDKPDLRFGMELLDCAEIGTINFDFVTGAIADGGILVGMVLPDGASMSRKQIDAVVDRSKQLGLGGLLWGKVAADGWTGPAAKGFGDDFKAAVAERRGTKQGDLFLAAVGKPAVVRTAMDRLRRELAAQQGLIPEGSFAFTWVVDFPLVGYDEEQGRHMAVHHPFTAPYTEDLDLLESDPPAVRSHAYDLVCNGQELGGGSLRIHDPEVQDRVFRALAISDEEADEKFGFLRKALRYGAPPHGGVAFGLDRLVGLLAGTDAIRDVIAFPKTTSASCPMTSAPAAVDEAQLADLHLGIVK